MCSARIRSPYEWLLPLRIPVSITPGSDVIESSGLPAFLWHFLRSIYRDNITRGIRGSTTMITPCGQRSTTRLSCEWFSFFAMAFDPIFRCLQETITPRNPDNFDILQPAQRAYADDLAVASLSFRGSMTALAPAFL